ncbi:flippase [Flavobacterium cyanobacteriorum]|uniref:Flippase n=1 Tax=Flavobacterium cyanobacteriorum TaxID=2022802 RepID=A0A255YSB2_9FLAO|nr:lipopolysaccharide biosynthesis protein [Flavobacterium cyanobacteriorum]OYQ32108.1 flippase [Flavobacterium cyanobacteriorum]
MDSLRKKTISGLLWTFSQQFGVQFINFFVSVVLARLLLPQEFGLIGMIAIFVAIGNSLVDSGMTSSLIRTENPDDIDYSTVFYTNFSISLLSYFIVYSLAPYISSFFSQDILIGIIRVYCLTFIIRAFSTVQSTRLNKEMNFKTQMLINIPSLVLGGVCGIILAYNGYGVWSLVYMNLIQTCIGTIQLWIYSKWKPKLVFSRERLKFHLGFGYKLTLAGLTDTFVKNFYNIIIGRVFPAAQLGFFTRAKTLQELPITNISAALNKVTYPVFSSIVNDNTKLNSVYKRLSQQVFFWVCPILTASVIVAEPLIKFLLTEKWLPAVPYFQLLCIAGIVTPLNSYNLNILLIKGRSDIYLRLGIVRNIIAVAGALLILPFGMYGLLYGIILSTYLTFFINAYFCGKYIDMSVVNQLKDTLPVFLISILAGLTGYFIEFLLISCFNSDLLVLIASVSCIFLFYFGISYAVKLPAAIEIKTMLLKR